MLHWPIEKVLWTIGSLQTQSLVTTVLCLKSLFPENSKLLYATIFYCPGVFAGMLNMGKMPTRWCEKIYQESSWTVPVWYMADLLCKYVFSAI